MIELKPLEDYPELRTARRLMRYVLLWCTEGETVLEIDDSEFILRPNDAITITSGQVHFLKSQSGAKGMILEFSYDFFCKDDTDIELIFHNGLFCHFDQNEVIPVADAATMNRLFSCISTDLAHRPYQYLVSVHACVELLLVAINRAKIARGDDIWKPNASYLKFLEIVRANFRQNYALGQLAGMLHTTEGKLNELSKLYTGKTAQMVIWGLVVSEAKRRLRYEDLSVKEVAAELGFNDPFYFSNFFKKQTGFSPTDWRKKKSA